MVNWFRGIRRRDEFTWNDCIFLIYCAYGIDAQFVGTLDSAVSAEERDPDRSDTLPVHCDLVVDDLAGICQNEIVKGNLVAEAIRPRGHHTSVTTTTRGDSRKRLPIVHLSGRKGGVAIGRC